MNKLQENLNFYRSYFSGIQDLSDESPAKVALGFLKIASVITVVVPIFFAAGYLINNYKLNNLNSLIDRASKDINKLSQNDLSAFFRAKVTDKDYVGLELALQKLDPNHQQFVKEIPEFLVESYSFILNQSHMEAICSIFESDMHEDYKKEYIEILRQSGADVSTLLNNYLFQTVSYFNHNYNRDRDRDLDLVKLLIELNGEIDPSLLHATLNFITGELNLKMMEFLLENCPGLDINAQDTSSGFTMLHRAVKSGNLRSVKLLIKQGANPFALTKAGETNFDILEKKDMINEYKEIFTELKFLEFKKAKLMEENEAYAAMPRELKNIVLGLNQKLCERKLR